MMQKWQKLVLCWRRDDLPLHSVGEGKRWVVEGCEAFTVLKRDVIRNSYKSSLNCIKLSKVTFILFMK